MKETNHYLHECLRDKLTHLSGILLGVNEEKQRMGLRPIPLPFMHQPDRPKFQAIAATVAALGLCSLCFSFFWLLFGCCLAVPAAAHAGLVSWPSFSALSAPSSPNPMLLLHLSTSQAGLVWTEAEGEAEEQSGTAATTASLMTIHCSQRQRIWQTKAP